MKSAELLCLSGLSSKETVTELSGRGIGMAALADACRPLGGVIDLSPIVAMFALQIVNGLLHGLLNAL